MTEGSQRVQDLLMQIVSLGYGFDVPQIYNALEKTNYQSVEAAVEYLLANTGDGGTDVGTTKSSELTQSQYSTSNNKNTNDNTSDNNVDINQEEEEKKLPVEFIWNVTLTEVEKELLMTGYIRMNVHKYIANEITKLLITYSNHWAILDDIIKCKPYCKYKSDIFDLFGIQLQLEIIPNGDPNNKHNDIKPESGSNVLRVQDVTDVVVGNGDNSCIILSISKLEELGLFRGDSVLIKGNRSSVLIALGGDQTENERIRMNDVVCRNVGAEYGDNVSLHSLGTLGEVRYGKEIYISPIKESMPSKNKSDLRPFGSSSFGNGRFWSIRTPQTYDSQKSVANELYNNYIKYYFQDSYRPCRIGDIYRIKNNVDRTSKSVEFQVTDITLDDNDGNDDNICIVAPETLIVINEPIDDESYSLYKHIDKPSIALYLKQLPSNIKNIMITFDIIIKEINETYSSSFSFTNDKLKYIKRHSKLIYMNKVKNKNHLSFGLKIKSMQIFDLNGKAINLSDYINQYQLKEKEQEQRKDKIEEMKVLRNKVLSLENETKSLKDVNERRNKRISVLETDNKKMKNIISVLENEKKELEIENIELRNEIKELKLENLNVDEYENWNSEELIDWIIHLESEKFAKYDNVLKDAFSKQNVDGSCIDNDIDRNDIMSWGINDYKDSKSLLKHLKSLINKNNDNTNIEGVSSALI